MYGGRSHSLAPKILRLLLGSDMEDNMSTILIIVVICGLISGFGVFIHNYVDPERIWYSAVFVNMILPVWSSILLLTTHHWGFVLGIALPWLLAIIVEITGHQNNIGEYIFAVIFSLIGIGYIIFTTSITLNTTLSSSIDYYAVLVSHPFILSTLKTLSIGIISTIVIRAIIACRAA